MIESAPPREVALNSLDDLDTASSSPEHCAPQGAEGYEMAIITAAQCGSMPAFNEIYRLYSPRLFRHILRITKNREDAEDALQDTFLRAYMGLHHFQARSAVYSWLTRIAVNSALMILRRRRHRPETLFACFSEDRDSYFESEVEDTAPNPEELCDSREQMKHLLLALQMLEPQLRTPVEIRFAGDRSLKEIADTLNISVAAVKSRLYRARVHLAKRTLRHSRAAKRSQAGLARSSSVQFE